MKITTKRLEGIRIVLWILVILVFIKSCEKIIYSSLINETILYTACLYVLSLTLLLVNKNLKIRKTK